NVTFKIIQNTKAESILIYNLLGQQIDQINLQNAAKGQQEISWEKAGGFARGTYLARLISDGKTVQVLKFTKQ
ncbi:MAG TPA: T9SS type A sorting domain-containing protein, partial [Adhaeribacter sp.]|nr:T9SS type A sorting domain-containing protein [Adhaeribacter sp.]